MDGSALLEDVLTSLDDDAPRIVYADWLLEQDAEAARVRGEFIQLSCAIARLPDEPTPQRATLVRRAMELLATWELTWVDELLAPLSCRRLWHGGGAVDWRWSRGFIEAYRSAPAFFLGRSLASLQRHTPLVEVEVSVSKLEELKEFLSQPGVRQLKVLSFRLWRNVGPEAFRLIATAPELVGLETLEVTWAGHDELGELVSVSGAFPRLSSLALMHSDGTAPLRERRSRRWRRRRWRPRCAASRSIVRSSAKRSGSWLRCLSS